MKSNVIILTSGLTGSSVLTALISRAGYWTGENTHKKPKYDTFENEELISLNLKIFEQGDYHGDYLNQFSPEAISRISTLSQHVDLAPYRLFLEKCNQHSPWVWKDPRLWLTIRFWKDLLDLKQCKFIVLSRGARQMWFSTLLRRQIVSYRDSKNFEQGVKQSAIEFLESNKLPYLRVQYEDLILQPAETIQQLNRYLETSLTVDDLKGVYHKPLYKSPNSSLPEALKALLIYAKNYSSR